MAAMKQEVAIRNQVIEQLEADVQTYLSEKLRLGETNAWLTEQNDALRKEVIAANRSFENSEARNKGLRIANNAYVSASAKVEAESASDALRLYVWKAVAIVALFGHLIVGAIILLS